MNIIRSTALVLCAAPIAALAAGGHDSVGCNGCHSIHAAKGEIIFAVGPNKTMQNPKSKQPYSGTTALCLACHADGDKGGQGIDPISQHMSHPFGLASVNPKIAKVPQELLREGGRFECLGCHDPHPSNPYYKYLRVDVGAKGQNMDAFCAVCHPIKADPGVASKVTFFTSMDETGNRAIAPASKGEPAAGKEPAAAEKKAPKKKK